jgi:hypothetical protein
MANIDDSPTKAFLAETDWRTTAPPVEALYDRWTDPDEQTNCINQPDSRIAADALRQALHRWMENTSDPLLDGDVPAPEGARVTDYRSYSASQRSLPRA